MPWNTKGVEGSYRFLTRVWRIFQDGKRVGGQTKPELLKKLHQTIKKVTEDIEELKHNTAIAALMEFLNAWSQEGSLAKKDAEIFIKLLAPFAPYLAEELWSGVLGNQYSVHQQPWPEFDPKLVKEAHATVVVQVNGKVRGQIKISAPKSKVKAELEKAAKAEKNVAKHLKGRKIRKTIFVPGKLINFVV
jgi:leucyl-tRNA synthetase